MVFEGATIPIPLGQVGLDGRETSDLVRIGALKKAEGIDYNGGIQSEGPTEKIDSNAVSGAPTCKGLIDWEPVEGTRRIVSSWDNGVVYKEVDGNIASVNLKGALGGSPLAQFTAGGAEVEGNNRKLFRANGNDAVQVLSGDGITMSTITSPPTDWSGATQPMALVLHAGPAGTPGGGFMWGLLNHRIYRSKSTDHEDFTTSVYNLGINPGEGQKLMAGVSFNGILYLFKDEGIYFLNDFNPDDTKWDIRKKTSKVGVASPQAWGQIGDDILLLDKSGTFHLLSAVQELEKETGNIKASSLSNAMEIDTFIRNNVNIGRLDMATSVTYPNKQTVEFSVPRKGTQVLNMRLRFNFSDISQVRFSHSDRDNANAMALRVDPASGVRKPIFGDDAGFVWQMDSGPLDTGYTREFEIHASRLEHVGDGSLGAVNKNFVGALIEFVGASQGNLTLTPIIDNKPGTARTVSMQGPGDPIDGTATGFTFPTSALGAEGAFTRRVRFGGSGRRLGVKGSGTEFHITSINYLVTASNSFPSARN